MRDTSSPWTTGSTTCTWPRPTWRESEQEKWVGMVGGAWGGGGVPAAAGWSLGRGWGASCCWVELGEGAECQLLLGGTWGGGGVPAAAGWSLGRGRSASCCWVELGEGVGCQLLLDVSALYLRLLVAQREAALLKGEKTDLEESVALLQSKL